MEAKAEAIIWQRASGGAGCDLSGDKGLPGWKAGCSGLYPLRYRNSGKLSHKITDYVFREGGAAVAIAIVLMAVLAYAVFTGHQADLGEKFWNVFLRVVGFYFGSNAPLREARKQSD